MTLPPEPRFAFTSRTPAEGPVGTLITITGTGLGVATGLQFTSSVYASEFFVVSDTQVTCRAPDLAPGLYGPSLLHPSGSSSIGGFTITEGESLLPTVTSMSPSTGLPGTPFTVFGANLEAATGILMRSTGAHNFVGGASQLSAVVPPLAPGPAAVVVQFHPTGNTLSAGTFNVTEPELPTVTSMNPQSGPTGTRVTVTGTNLSAATGLTFGGVAGSSPAITATTVSAVIPSSVAMGPQAVVVVLPLTGNVTAGTFTVEPPASANAPSPLSGTPGTLVTVTGTRLSTATGMTFRGVAGSGFTVVSATEVRAVVPTLSAGVASVVVVFPAGTNNLIAGNFTVTDPPAVTGFSPPRADPGATVTITGTNLTGVTVTVRGVVAAVTSASATQVQVTVPAGLSPGPATIQLHYPGGVVNVGSLIVTEPPCRRRAWLVLDGRTIDLEDLERGYACEELNLGWPAVREVVTNRPDADGADDRTRLFGERVITARIVAMSKRGSAAMDDIAREFAPFCMPATRPELHFTLETPEDNYAERMVRVRPANYAAPIAGGYDRNITLGFVAPDPFLWDSVERSIVSTRVSWAYFDTGGTLGDVIVRPRIRITGPILGPALYITNRRPEDAAAGNTYMQFVSTFNIPAGRYVEIDGARRTVRWDNGTNVLASVSWAGGAFRWPAVLPPALSYAGFRPQLAFYAGTGQTTDTRATAYWRGGYLA